MKISRWLSKCLLLLFVSLGCLGQTVYQLKAGNKEFQERMSYYRPKNVESFDLFYDQIIDSLESRDYRVMADLIKYPIKVEVKGKYITLLSRAEFVKRGELIMEDNFIKLLLCEREKLYCVSQGVQLGRGELWFNTMTEDDREIWKLIAINN